MNGWIKGALSITLLAAAAFGGFWFGQRPAVLSHGVTSSDAPSALPTTNHGATPGADAPREILYYRNPMGLADTSPVPKKDSMGMDYIPVYADDAPDATGAVKVSPARLQALGVRTAFVDQAPLALPLRAVGQVQVNERLIREIAPRFSGWIETLRINVPGDVIQRGDTLFTVYSPELLAAHQDYQLAKTLQAEAVDTESRQLASTLLDAAATRLRNWQVRPDIPPQQAGRVPFSAPVDGVLLSVDAVQGKPFAAGASLYRIADLSSVWVVADVFARDVGRLQPGQAVRITVDALPGQAFEARVDAFYPELNPATRTLRARFQVDNPKQHLRPGMLAHVEVDTGTGTPVLQIPRSALIEYDEQRWVLQVKGEGRYSPVKVSVGARGTDAVEITEGLQRGDEVVVAANFLIDAESQLKSALQGFTDPEATFPRYDATGRVEGIDLQGQSLTLYHTPIPALNWPAMTMDFTVDPQALPANLLPGQPIRFQFEDRGDGEFVVISLQVDTTAAQNHEGH